MYKVLIFSYYFPPKGLSGVQRTTKFVKYLPEFNWSPTVITTGDIANPDEYSDRTYSKEIYAKNVGLVYKELTNWVYQSTVVKFRKGFTLIYRAKKYTP